jgi:bifunctional UDP-N-acetylglucosamine pyrophosphorylase/glucosamine-1-phosphate N-acetyltransferase
MSLTIVILAAGQSKRMNSKLSKVFHPVGGLPVIEHVTSIAKSLNPQEILYVTSPLIAERFQTPIIQHEARGTGDAVRLSLPHIKGDQVMILCGDVPLFENDFLKEMLGHRMSLLSMEISDPKASYGRIELDGAFVKCIKEAKDLSSQEKQNPLMNTGICLFETQFLKNHIHKLKDHNGEFYLTDMVEIAYQEKQSCAHIAGPVLHGINTREDLAKAENSFQEHARQKAFAVGATLIGKESVFFSHDTKVSKDCIIGPHVTFGPKVCLEEDVKILSFSHIEEATIKSNTTVGPFAHLRGGVTLGENVHIGNFVEIKGSRLGNQSKVKHLSYIGDCDIGERVNIGAGTIVCNYNGVKKFKTIIEDGVFIGSNSTLIAPITVKKECYVAAGTVVTKSIPEQQFAISRVDMRFKDRK